MKKLVSGKYYTVIEGEHKGVTGVAIGSFDGDEATLLSSIDFPKDMQVAGRLGDLREATEAEAAQYCLRIGRRRD